MPFAENNEKGQKTLEKTYGNLSFARNSTTAWLVRSAAPLLFKIGDDAQLEAGFASGRHLQKMVAKAGKTVPWATV
jgi:hypothetical protein